MSNPHWDPQFLGHLESSPRIACERQVALQRGIEVGKMNDVRYGYDDRPLLGVPDESEANSRPHVEQAEPERNEHDQMRIV